MPSAPQTPETNKKNKTRKTPLPPVQCNQNADNVSDDDEESYTMCATFKAQFDGLHCEGGCGVTQHKYPTLPMSLQPASGGDEPRPKTPPLPASGGGDGGGGK